MLGPTAIDSNWEVSVLETKAMLDRGEDFLFLDVRQPEEHAICRIEGAKLVPLGELPNRIEEIRSQANGRPIVIHCHHGGRSLSAAAMLREAAMADAKSMAGGIDAWSLQVDHAVPRY